MSYKRVQDIPQRKAYLVFHDAYDDGAMDVLGLDDIEQARKLATHRNTQLEDEGLEEGGGWAAYEKLPDLKIWSYNDYQKS